MRITKIPILNRIHLIALLGLIPFMTNMAMDGGLIRIKNLEGTWKFSIGEREEWVQNKFDDSNWETVDVPSPWEDEGFYGYNGFAFYRKSFIMPGSLKGKNLYLVLGYIDDVDETYVNGHKIGSTGSFPPGYNTAYNAKRIYSIPKEIINFDGQNLIAVKVYDAQQYGGIVDGEVGIYANPNEAPVEISLQGKWKFKTGDELDRKSTDYNDDSWDEIFVPGKWEDQGYREYDGYAWYRKTFIYRGELDDTKSVLVLGKIDDGDVVYINGVEIGSTGSFSPHENGKFNCNDCHRAMRGYYLNTSLLKKNQKNTIAIRIYDKTGTGGVYEGPVGFITQKNYIKFWREKRKNN